MNYLKLIPSILVLISYCSADVVDLNGNADFRSVKLRWKYRKDLPDVTTFEITYCEDQAWGKYRCRDQLLNPNSINSIHGSDEDLTYEASINGLRLSTNYTIEVNPVFIDPRRANPQRARALGSHLWIQTKGFYARAINCLTDESLIEIETGPYFGGKISVEGSTDPKCWTQGDGSSNKTMYRLAINHELCGSKMNISSVKTFVIVQENLPILTHSTRRFMVICNYVPETFTVRAGVHLPDYEDTSGNNLVPVDQDVFEVDPSELFDSSNNLFSSRVGKNVGRALRFSSENKKEEPQRWAHMVLMVVLVMAALIGVTCAVGHFVRTSRFRSRNRPMSSVTSSSEAPSVLEINSNLDIQDFDDDLCVSVNGIVPEASLATLTNFDSLGDQMTVIRTDGEAHFSSDNPIVDFVLDDLHPLNFELDDPLTLMTMQDQHLPPVPSNSISHQIILNESPMPIFMSCANVVSVPYPLIPIPSFNNRDEHAILAADNLTCIQNVLPTIVLPDIDLHNPLSDVYDDISVSVDTFSSGSYDHGGEEKEALFNCNPHSNIQMEGAIFDSDNGHRQTQMEELDENNLTTDNNIETADGNTNWKLKDQNGIVYPATAV